MITTQTSGLVSLIDYVHKGNAGAPLRVAESLFGKESVRTAAIITLNWLERQSWLPFTDTVDCKTSCKWVQALMTLLHDGACLNGLLQISNEKLCFQPSISDADKAEIIAFVASNYQPMVFILPQEERWSEKDGERMGEGNERGTGTYDNDS